MIHLYLPRRRFLHSALSAAAFATVPGAFAEALSLTPKQTEGPFYPNKLPLDTDNDLLVITDSITPAIGEVAYLSGRILTSQGEPVRNALVEIWQCDGNGVYLHTGGGSREKQDKNFQGYGRFLTGIKGEYLFRTIKPVPYTGRTPHIHVKVKHQGKELVTSQCYIKDHAQNATDGIWKSVKDEKIRAMLDVEFQPLPGAKAGELTGTFDIVVGLTPNEK